LFHEVFFIDSAHVECKLTILFIILAH
jgi:hypothetical protein